MVGGETGKKLLFFKSNPDWYDYPDDDEEAFPILTDKAPPEAVESYNFAKKWYEMEKRSGTIH